MVLSRRSRVGTILTGLTVAGLTAVCLPAGSAAAADEPAPLVGLTETGVVEDKYIVVLDEDASTKAVANAAKRARGAGGDVTHQYTHAIKGFAASLSEAELDEVRADPAVEYVEAAAVMRLADVAVTAARPGDTGIRKFATDANLPNWGLDRIDQRTRPLNDRYFFDSRAQGAGVSAYVLDTGVRASHGAFQTSGGGSRVATGFDATGEDDGADDCFGHGTHVAGVVGGGLVGIARQATVVPVQVFRCDGEDPADNSGLLAGIDWVIADHDAGEPAVANLSLGAPAGGGNVAIDTAVKNLVADGVTAVVSAGNTEAGHPVWGDPSACHFTPSSVPEAITVSATGADDKRPSWAKYGRCVDIFAPGHEIVSAWHTGDDVAAVSSGTSMAAPHVAGVAATYLGEHPSATPAQVWAAISGAATAGVVRDAGKSSANKLLYSPLADEPAKTTAADRITSGTALRRGEKVTSPNGLYTLTQQTDGKLVLSKPGNRALWTLNTAGTWTTMATNGRLTSYDYAKPLWNTNGTGAAEARVQNDGNLVVYRLSDKAATWASRTTQRTAPAQVTTPTSTLTSGRALYRGGRMITSPNGSYSAFVRPTTGELVVKRTGGPIVWTTGAKKSDWLVLQADGNLVLYNSNGAPVWASGTAGKGTSRLVMQNDGNLVLYRTSTGKATWSSKSGRR